MNILNIHGFRGTAENVNYRIASSCGYSITSPQLDYEVMNPYVVEKYLSYLVEQHNVNLILATDLGAFFGKVLAIKYKLPCIFTNPCFRPDISLRNIAPEYFNNCTAFYINSAVNRIEKSSFLRDVIILGSEDYVVSPSITTAMAPTALIYTVPGGHYLTTESCSEIISECIANQYSECIANRYPKKVS